ncbi:hypothetical protein SAMN05660349_02313 [Macellibacteroides fermentans]|uniref:Uncharacterized protein n=1 Tax=Parabacteroides chartae TaxID=1037355 RepID=A0A1T5D947_9BACT|nr:hypothetical protein SAMN05660349_02313 [Parabacteroides chartae]
MSVTTNANRVIGRRKPKMQELRTFIKSKGANNVKTIINNKIQQKK